jgi:peptide/nickel transport system ATP-binding protein
MAEAGKLLEVRDLKVAFRTTRGRVQALAGVSLDVSPGEVLGVVGESGSGKTMTVLAVMSLITDPNAEITGSIRFRGEELIGAPAAKLRSLRGGKMAMIFQDPMTSLTPVHSIGWQIVEQIRAHGPETARQARDKAVELLAAVGLPSPGEAVDHYPHQLSGGMRQRAVIAMALSCSPALLIADEPTTALDVTVQAQILDLLQRLRRGFGSAIVFITHDMGVIAEIADRVLVMYAGRVVETANKRNLFLQPRHPYTRALLQSIPPITGERARRLRSIRGAPPSLHAMPQGCAFAPRCEHRFAACQALPPLVGEPEHQAACFLLQQASTPAEASP